MTMSKKDAEDIYPEVLNFDRPIKKDTIMMPVGGYVAVRFQATNPGEL